MFYDCLRFKDTLILFQNRSFDELVGGTFIEVTDAADRIHSIELDEQSLLCRHVTLPGQTNFREIQRIEGKINSKNTLERLLEIDNVEPKPAGEWFPSSLIIPSYSTKRSDRWEVTYSKVT